MSTNGVVGIELPESRKVALETTINQLRLARKSLLIVNLENGIEDRVLDLITDCVHHLQPVLDTCVVVRVRSDKKEAEELSSDISESVGEVIEKNDRDVLGDLAEL